MTISTINLQNTPNHADTVSRPVSFASGPNTLKGMLYRPATGDGPFPALIVTGAWTTVKEQMAGTYAREMAAKGFIALAFDFTGWGESSGSPRYVEDPVQKTADIKAATDFLAAQPEVDTAALSGLGICASSGYMAERVADDPRLTRLALVAPWLHDPKMAEGIYGGPEAAAGLIAASLAPGAADTTLLAASADDDSAIMYQAPYYTETDRGLISAYDNQFSPLSWKPWLTYDAQVSADRLNTPVLMVGSPSIALLAGAEAYEARLNRPVEKLWLGEDATQFDFYDRKDVVDQAVDAVAAFLKAA